MRLAIVCDFREENWPSMDLAAEMLCSHLQADEELDVQAVRICPPLVRRFTRLPGAGSARVARNADRLVNRFLDYPGHLRCLVKEFDCFHVCDHSYAHLVHELPPDRTGVYCHDLDTFCCLLDPQSERRQVWFRAMTRRILTGLQKAALVFCSTQVMLRRIVRAGLVDPARLVYAPYGISRELTPEEDGEHDNLVIDSLRIHLPFVLHVGSCIARKRTDILLEVFAAVRENFPHVMLVQVGGLWSAEQAKQIERLELASAIRQVRGLDRQTLAALYRRAALILLPSEAEGFGLPLIEGLACGNIALASDIPVLREVGGAGAVYCPVADVPRWVETVKRLLANPASAPPVTMRLERARTFSWETHARTISHAYEGLGSISRELSSCAGSQAY